jgi:hypothetical protein
VHQVGFIYKSKQLLKTENKFFPNTSNKNYNKSKIDEADLKLKSSFATVLSDILN